MAKKYKRINESLTDLDSWDLEGSVDDVIARLQALKTKHPEHTKLILDLDAGHNSIEVSLRGERLETDKERDKRLADARKNRAKETERKEIEAQAERQEYERLKTKFEGT